jgi:hypothetical protein
MAIFNSKLLVYQRVREKRGTWLNQSKNQKIGPSGKYAVRS